MPPMTGTRMTHNPKVLSAGEASAPDILPKKDRLVKKEMSQMSILEIKPTAIAARTDKKHRYRTLIFIKGRGLVMFSAARAGPKAGATGIPSVVEESLIFSFIYFSQIGCNNFVLSI